MIILANLEEGSRMYFLKYYGYNKTNTQNKFNNLKNSSE